MSEPEANTIPFQSHSNKDNYLATPCISIDTNPAKYYKENHRNHRKFPSLVKLAKEFLEVPFLSSTVETFSQRCRLNFDRFK